MHISEVINPDLIKIFQIKLWRSFFSFCFFDLHLVSKMDYFRSQKLVSGPGRLTLSPDSHFVKDLVMGQRSHRNEQLWMIS